jgi:thioredoxin reductase (NADPH)
MLDRARVHDKIHFMTDTVVEEVMDVAAKEVTALKLRNVLSGKVWDFPASAMFLGIGHTPNASMFRGTLETDEDGYLKVRDYVHTGIPGVYACGDVADRRYRQAITASGTGCMAAIEVEKYLEATGH